MTSPAGPRPLVVGVGNDDRTDDGAGLDVARELAGRRTLPADVRVWTAELTGLLDVWKRRPLVILVDAVRSGEEPGTVRRFTAEELAAPSPTRTFSTHGISLPDVIDLGRTLEALPDRLVVYGVETSDTRVGTGRSAEVRRGVMAAAARIVEELAAGVSG